MRYWAGVVEEHRYATERLYAHETVRVDTSGQTPVPGDQVLLIVATDPPMLFGLGRVRLVIDGSVVVRYTHRLLDDPLPVPSLLGGGLGLCPVTPEDFEPVAELVPASRRTDADRQEWFVSVALPIEAASRAEAVREFWTYVEKLGPRELPAYVWPRGDELAMQAFLLGAQTNLDPEEDDD